MLTNLLEIEHSVMSSVLNKRQLIYVWTEFSNVQFCLLHYDLHTKNVKAVESMDSNATSHWLRLYDKTKSNLNSLCQLIKLFEPLAISDGIN